MPQSAPQPHPKQDYDKKEQSATTTVNKRLITHVRSNTMDTDIDTEVISLDDFLS